jgi:hypothetical protein
MTQALYPVSQFFSQRLHHYCQDFLFLWLICFQIECLWWHNILHFLMKTVIHSCNFPDSGIQCAEHRRWKSRCKLMSRFRFCTFILCGRNQAIITRTSCTFSFITIVNTKFEFSFTNGLYAFYKLL